MSITAAKVTQSSSLSGEITVGAASRPSMQQINRSLLPFVVPVLLLGAWQWASLRGVLPSRILPAPLAVIAVAQKLIASGDLWRHLSVSAGRAFGGLAVGGGIGFALGLLTGASRWAETLLDGTVQMLRAIPNLALLPFVIIWFGIGEEAKTFLIAFGVFFPCTSIRTTAFARWIPTWWKWHVPTACAGSPCSGTCCCPVRPRPYSLACALRWVPCG